MVDAEAPQGGGAVDSGRFLDGDGTAIQWTGLAMTIVGGAISAAWAMGIEIVLSIGDAISGLLGDAAAWGADFIGVLVASPAATIEALVAQTVAFVASTGIGGFVLAVAFVLTMYYVIERVIDR